jgi:hypothetical protein
MNLSKLIDIIQEETTSKPEWDDPNYLSELLLRLASYYSTLGRFVAEAEQRQDFAEIQYKVGREQAKVDNIQSGDSVALAESKAAVLAGVDQNEVVNLKYKARLLFLTRQSLDKTLDAIRSRLSYVKMDKDNHDFKG